MGLRGLRVIPFVLTGVLLVSGGVAAASVGEDAVPVGSSRHTIVVDGLQRGYRGYRPAGLPSPAPLVVMLHGGFGSGAQAERAYGWDALADTEHFAVAYPDGIGRAWAVGGGCCGEPGRSDVDDVGFVTAMVAALSRRLPVDPARVYVPACPTAR